MQIYVLRYGSETPDKYIGNFNYKIDSQGRLEIINTENNYYQKTIAIYNKGKWIRVATEEE